METIPSSNQFGARHQQVLGLRFACHPLWQLHDSKDRAHADACVKVARAINRITSNYISRTGTLVEVYDLLFLFRNECSAASRSSHGRDEQIVSDHVEFLLVITGGVGGAGQTGQVDQRGSTDVVGDGLEGELEGVA